MDNKKLGRPKLPENQRQKYQRVALYPETHAAAKTLAAKDGKRLIDWFDDLVKNVPKDKVEEQPKQKKKKFPFL